MSTTPNILKNCWILVDSQGRMLVNWMDSTIWHTNDKEVAETLAAQLNRREAHKENPFQAKEVEFIRVYPELPEDFKFRKEAR